MCEFIHNNCVCMFIMKGLSQLKYLDIWGSKISNKGVGFLKMFRNLSFLNLAWTRVTRLLMLQSLKCLNMGKCSIDGLFGEGAAETSLSKLLLHGSTFSDVREIFSCVTLDELVFLDISGSDVEDFFFLRKMPQLEHLDLSFSRMTDKQFDTVAQIGKKLITLDLGSTKISSHGISILAASVPNLKELVLSYTAVDDVGLLYIGSMPSLKSIILNNTNVRGNDLLHIIKTVFFLFLYLFASIKLIFHTFIQGLFSTEDMT